MGCTSLRAHPICDVIRRIRRADTPLLRGQGEVDVPAEQFAPAAVHNCPALPIDGPSGYGPRVEAVCTVLAGAYRIGKRGIARLMGDLFGMPIGPAAVCDLQHKTARALEPVAAQAHAHVTGKAATGRERLPSLTNVSFPMARSTM